MYGVLLVKQDTGRLEQLDHVLVYHLTRIKDG